MVIIPFQLMALLCMLQYLGIPLVSWVLTLQKLQLIETFKGPVTGAVVLFWGAGCYLAYLICYRNVDYGAIPAKLQRYRFFSQYSALKLFSLIMLNFVLFFYVVEKARNIGQELMSDIKAKEGEPWWFVRR
jgi:hypothetical protein